jgi:hypothetical protein
MHSNEALLMTATINVANTLFAAINSPEERLFQYLCSLISWIKLTRIDTIIFCENSNTSYDFGKIIEFANNEGKTLEVLVFNGNQGAQRSGKGYGEGRIIEYALKKSKNLKDDVNFYKITGRLFVNNFEEIQQKHANTPNVFKIPAWGYEKVPDYLYMENVSSILRPFKLTANLFRKYLFALKTRGLKGPHDPLNNVFTRFYKVNVKFFKETHLDSYKKVSDRWGYYLECAYYDDLIGKDFSPFLSDIHLIGMAGHNCSLLDGGDYPDDIKNLAKTFM